MAAKVIKKNKIGWLESIFLLDTLHFYITLALFGNEPSAPFLWLVVGGKVNRIYEITKLLRDFSLILL
jgi:hypothetical protein